MSFQREASSFLFVGVSLSGGRVDKSSICELEFYPQKNRLFVRHNFHGELGRDCFSADELLLDYFYQKAEQIRVLVFDTPVSLPPCAFCTCPSRYLADCPDSDVQWLLKQQSEKAQRPKRSPTPYTQRALDYFLENAFEEKWDYGHALGSNLGPLSLRTRFLIQRLPKKLDVYETPVKISSYILARSLGFNRYQALELFSSSEQNKLRSLFFEAMVTQTGIFFYEQDKKDILRLGHFFQAFISAYMGFLKQQGSCFVGPEWPFLKKVLLPKEAASYLKPSYLNWKKEE